MILRYYKHIALGFLVVLAGVVLIKARSNLLKWILILTSIFLLSFSLVSCSLLQVVDSQKLAEQTYKKDLKAKINGKTYIGVGVLPKSTQYEITLFPSGNVDRIIVQSCSRELVVDKPKKDGWLKNTYTFNYTPLAGLETRTSCPLEIAVIEQRSVKNGFAFFEFEDEREEVSLTASLQCNGQQEIGLKGVGLCQSAAGLRQRIWFKEKTILAGVNKECDVMETDDGFFYDFSVAPHKCVYHFVSQPRAKNGKRIYFRLSTIGYTALVFRED